MVHDKKDPAAGQQRLSNARVPWKSPALVGGKTPGHYHIDRHCWTLVLLLLGPQHLVKKAQEGALLCTPQVQPSIYRSRGAAGGLAGVPRWQAWQAQAGLPKHQPPTWDACGACEPQKIPSWQRITSSPANQPSCKQNAHRAAASGLVKCVCPQTRHSRATRPPKQRTST